MTSPARLSAAELIDLVLDADSWTSWDVAPERGEVEPSYAAELVAAQERSGADEPEEYCRRVGAVLQHELSELLARGPSTPAQRAARYGR